MNEYFIKFQIFFDANRYFVAFLWSLTRLLTKLRNLLRTSSVSNEKIVWLQWIIWIGNAWKKVHKKRKENEIVNYKIKS